MRLFLFDCDGTIADSFAMICGTMHQAFSSMRLTPPDEAAIHGIIGLSLAEAMLRLQPGATMADAELLADAYRSCFQAARAAGQVREPLFDGMGDLITGLTGRDENFLGMVTGKSRRGVSHILETHGLQQHFHVIRTADDCPSKPHPAMVLECCAETGIEPERTIVIGDAAFDMAMARAAGATAIGVTWGAGKADMLLEAGAHGIASSVAELDRMLADWQTSESMSFA